MAVTAAANEGQQDMDRAGMWLRVSSGHQDEANQEPDIRRYCDQQDYRVTKTYQLHAESASKGEQEAALAEVIDDVRRGVIKILVPWHSDRLDRRGVKEALDFIVAVRRAGGRVESAKEGPLDENSIDTIVTSWINYQKSKHLSEQIRAAHDTIRANGAAMSRAPWGMTIAGPKYNKAFVPADEGRKWVPQIFDKVIDGWTLAEISLWLRDNGVRGGRYANGDDTSLVDPDKRRNRDGLWHESSVGAMIRNPIYMGFRCQQDQKTKRYGKVLSRCEPLVDAATWRRANEALDRRPKRGYTNLDDRPMLSGMLKCGNLECDASGAPDSPMVRNTSSTRRYYRCRGLGAVPKSCGLMVRLDLVDAAVDQTMRNHFNIPKMELTVIPGTDHSAELAALEFELRKLPERGLEWEDEDAERARLRAEIRRVRALPVVPDVEKWEPTGKTFAELWAEVSPADRAKWLRAEGFTVRANKTLVTVAQGDEIAEIPLVSPTGRLAERGPSVGEVPADGPAADVPRPAAPAAPKPDVGRPAGR